MATSPNLRPHFPRRASSTAQSTSSAHPKTSSTSRPADPVHPQPTTTVHPQPTATIHPRASPIARPSVPIPLQSTNPSRPTYSPSCGHGRRSTNVTYDSPAFREASQAARRARSINDRSGRDAPSSSQRRVRLPSEDSDSDDQPLAQRLRRRAPNPSQDSGPSAVPPPSPPVATTTPIPSQADAPAPREVQAEPPLAQPSTSQQHPSTEAGPSNRPSPTTSPPEPSHVPPSAPSGSAAGPSQPPPPTYHHYRTTAPSEAELRSRQDVTTTSFTMKGRLATLWEENISFMFQACTESLIIDQSFHVAHYPSKVLRDRVAELELQLNDPA
ncbi:extensin-like [Zingiber officinale]|uniref:extensin-like n=1 Tax=Zingiber officinale TaxID=94328 RepID=UPI001C4D3912|nr:extensin-like [Zingiber officinale]